MSHSGSEGTIEEELIDEPVVEKRRSSIKKSASSSKKTSPATSKKTTSSSSKKATSKLEVVSNKKASPKSEVVNKKSTPPSKKSTPSSSKKTTPPSKKSTPSSSKKTTPPSKKTTSPKSETDEDDNFDISDLLSQLEEQVNDNLDVGEDFVIEAETPAKKKKSPAKSSTKSKPTAKKTSIGSKPKFPEIKSSLLEDDSQWDEGDLETLENLIDDIPSPKKKTTSPSGESILQKFDVFTVPKRRGRPLKVKTPKTDSDEEDELTDRLPIASDEPQDPETLTHNLLPNSFPNRVTEKLLERLPYDVAAGDSKTVLNIVGRIFNQPGTEARIFLRNALIDIALNKVGPANVNLVSFLINFDERADIKMFACRAWLLTCSAKTELVERVIEHYGAVSITEPSRKESKLIDGDEFTTELNELRRLVINYFPSPRSNVKGKDKIKVQQELALRFVLAFHTRSRDCLIYLMHLVNDHEESKTLDRLLRMIVSVLKLRVKKWDLINVVERHFEQENIVSKVNLAVFLVLVYLLDLVPPATPSSGRLAVEKIQQGAEKLCRLLRRFEPELPPSRSTHITTSDDESGSLEKESAASNAEAVLVDEDEAFHFALN